MTPVQYIQMVRIERAKDLLNTSDKSIGEVGKLVGLPNTPYFITLFKKKTGYTPLQYRKKFVEESIEEGTDNGTK